MIDMKKRKKKITFYVLQITMETHISHNNDSTIEQVISRLSMEESKCIKPQSKGETRGQRLTGLTHECGVFGCIASGDWPSQIDVAQVVCLGKYTHSMKEI